MAEETGRWNEWKGTWVAQSVGLLISAPGFWDWVLYLALPQLEISFDSLSLSFHPFSCSHALSLSQMYQWIKKKKKKKWMEKPGCETVGCGDCCTAEPQLPGTCAAGPVGLTGCELIFANVILIAFGQKSEAEIMCPHPSSQSYLATKFGLKFQIPFLRFHSLCLLIVPYVPVWSLAPHTCPASPLFFLGTPLPKSSVLLSCDRLGVLSCKWPECSPLKRPKQ